MHDWLVANTRAIGLLAQEQRRKCLLAGLLLGSYRVS